MFRIAKTACIGAAIAACGALSAETASAQWGAYYGPSYYGPSYRSGVSFGFSTGPGYSSYYGPYDYGYSSYHAGYPVYQSHYGHWHRGPRRVEYDFYTPYGRADVNYRFRRDGSVRVDVDD